MNQLDGLLCQITNDIIPVDPLEGKKFKWKASKVAEWVAPSEILFLSVAQVSEAYYVL